MPDLPKHPTNADLYKLLTTMDNRISALEQWKLTKEAAAAAIREYQEQESSRHRNAAKGELNKEWREVLKQLGWILGMVGLALYVYLSTHGTRP